MVSLILRAGFFFGLEVGVWTAQHSMKTYISIINIIANSAHAHQ